MTRTERSNTHNEVGNVHDLSTPVTPFFTQSGTDISPPDTPHSTETPASNVTITVTPKPITVIPNSGLREKIASTTDPVFVCQAKGNDQSDKIDILLFNAQTQSEEIPSKSKEQKRRSDWLLCQCIVGIFEKLSPKKNRMAKIDIQKILLDYEFINKTQCRIFFAYLKPSVERCLNLIEIE